MTAKQKARKASSAKKDSLIPASFDLPEVVTIDTAADVAVGAMALPLQSGVRLTLDVGKVAHISTPGIQLMIALAKTVETFGGEMHMTLPPAPVVQAFRDAGLKDYLDKLIAPR